MRAVLRLSLDDPTLLHLTELPEPVPASGEAVVAVDAAALNFADLLMLRGAYQQKPPLPFSPGAEIAGRIVALAADTDGFAVGDRVVGFTGCNGCRERVAVAARSLVPIPAPVSDAQAAGLSITYGTALHAFCDRARLQPGETVAVLGAGGGAGLAAVEIAALMGARVIACASSPDKLALARAHGAAETVDAKPEDLKARLKELSGGGIDVVYDVVGGDLTEPALRALSFGGRLLVIGFASGTIPAPKLNLALVKGISLVGVHYGAFAARESEKARAQILQLLDWCAEGRLRPHVHGTFPLAETEAALRVIEKREARGKVLVAPQL